MTVDEIHTIRVEHSERARNLSLEEYRKLLEVEATPVRSAIEYAKRALLEKNVK